MYSIFEKEKPAGSIGKLIEQKAIAYFSDAANSENLNTYVKDLNIANDINSDSLRQFLKKIFEDNNNIELYGAILDEVNYKDSTQLTDGQNRFVKIAIYQKVQNLVQNYADEHNYTLTNDDIDSARVASGPGNNL